MSPESIGLLDLPQEIVVQIFSYLSPRDRCHTILVCPRFVEAWNHPKYANDQLLNLQYALLDQNKAPLNFLVHSGRKYSTIRLGDNGSGVGTGWLKALQQVGQNVERLILSSNLEPLNEILKSFPKLFEILLECGNDSEEQISWPFLEPNFQKSLADVFVNIESIELDCVDSTEIHALDLLVEMMPNLKNLRFTLTFEDIFNELSNQNDIREPATSLEAIIKLAAKKGHTLRRLCVRKCRSPNEQFQQLLKSELNLFLNGEFFENLAKLNLLEFHFPLCFVSDRQVQHLQKTIRTQFKALESLQLYSFPLPQGFAALRELHLDLQRPNDIDLKSFAPAVNLEKLQLVLKKKSRSQSYWINQNHFIVGQNPKLCQITFIGWDDRGVRFLQQLVDARIKLTSLSCCGMFQNEDLRLIWTRFPQLKYLVLRFSPIRDEVFYREDANCPRITYKILRNCSRLDISPPRNKGVIGINQLVHLEFLKLHSISNEMFSNLSLPQLRTLIIKDCKQIHDEGIAKLAQNCPKLENLVLEQNDDVTDEAIHAISLGLKELKELSLIKFAKLSWTAMEHVQENCKNLRVLKVKHKNMGRHLIRDECWRRLMRAVPSLKRIETSNKMFNAC